jgi:DNA-binding PadR family transcriptional regulator
MTGLLELLWAVTTKHQHTTGAIAAATGLSEPEAEHVLGRAERDGWVSEDIDESRHVGRGFDRQFWRITAEGQAEMNRLEDDSGRHR